MDILPIRREKDRKTNRESEQIKEDKHLVKVGSIKPQKGHSIFKVIGVNILPVEPEDYIESIAVLHFINKQGEFRYSASIKLKQGFYISALNRKNAIKQLK